MDWRDIVRRALKTAGQTFLAVATVDVFLDLDIETFQLAAASGIASGFAIIHNAILGWLSSDLKVAE